MNKYHNKLVNNIDNLGREEIFELADKAIENYARGYNFAIQENDTEKKKYFNYRITQIIKLVNSQFY